MNNSIIYIDHREMRSEIPNLLKQQGNNIRIVNNQITDYLLGGGYGIERKTYPDFISSIYSKRIFNQVKVLKDNFSHPLLIIENKPLFKSKSINKNLLRGSMIYIMVKQRVPIIKTENPQETAKIIISLSRSKQNFEPSSLLTMQSKKRAISTPDKQKRVIEAFPGIGPKMASKILKHFKSINDFCLADEKEIRKVEGVGQKRAKEIYGLINELY